MAIPEQELQPPTPDQAGEGFKPTPDAYLLFELASGYATENYNYDQYEFEQITERACSNIFNPLELEAAQKIGEVVAWSLFTPPGSPLPDPLIRVGLSEGRYDIDYSPASGLNNTIAGDVLKSRFMNAGLGDFHSHRVRRMSRFSSGIEERLHGIMEAQPEYQFLMSFNVQNPHKIDEAPLTPQQLLLRKKQIEQQTRERFSVPDDRPLNDNPAAAQYFTRATYNLDEETQPRRNKESPEKPPLERLKDHYRKAIAHGFNKQVERRRQDIGNYHEHSDFIPEDLEEKIVHIGQQSLHEKASIHTNMSDFSLSISDFDLEPFFPKFSHINKNGYARPAVLSTYMYAHAFDILFSNESRAHVQNFEQFVEQLMIHPRNSILEHHWYANGIGLDMTASKYDSYVGWAKQPTGPVISDASANSAHFQLRQRWMAGEVQLLDIPKSNGTIRMSITHRDNLEGDERQAKAWVLRRPQHDTKNRLVIGEQEVFGIPPIDYDQPDQLILNAPTPATEHQSFPYVPGYQLVGRDGLERFAYTYTPGQEPYQSADIPISSRQQNFLGDTYGMIGLASLGIAVQSSPELTVQTLADLIATHSHYETEFYSRHQTPRNFDDFCGFIRDGQLRVQCDGAANFLKLSLDQIFGEGSSAIQTGLVMTANEDRISGIGHAQVLFTHKGKQYMLDATAASEQNLLSEPGIAARPIRAARARAEAQAKAKEDGATQPRRRFLKRSNTKQEETTKLETKLPKHLQLLKPRRPHKKAAKQAKAVQAAEEQTLSPQSPTKAREQVLAEIEQTLTPTTNEAELKQEQRAAAAQACRDLLESQLSTMLKIDRVEELRANINKLPEPNLLRRTLVAASKAAGIGLSAEEAEKLHDYIGSYQQAVPSNLGGANKLQAYSPELLDVLGRTAQTLLDLN